MILALRIVSSVAIVAGWIELNSLLQVGTAMLIADTVGSPMSPLFDESAYFEKTRLLRRDAWINMAVTGGISGALLVLLWWRRGPAKASN